LSLVVVWAASGRLFGYSDTWQLVINTGTTIVTFLMVFLIQNTQNRDSHALHLKLDELIRTNKHARDRMMMLEELSEAELDDLQKEFDRLAMEKVAERRERTSSTPPPPPSSPSTARQPSRTTSSARPKFGQESRSPHDR
jgi:low affinity Fe/Cu permease